MTRVKLCGITSVDDARLCLEHRPWALGLIFVASSPRRARLGAALEVAALARREAEVVGVFQNATLDHVTRTAESLELTMVQLHGDEGPSYCAEVARRTGAKVMKAVRVRSRADVVGLEAFHVDFHMLDAYVPGARGGTGESFNWDLVALHPRSTPVVLSGGLNPDNVAQAVREVRPYAVDTASGTEAAPGRKDPAKLAAFFRAVEAADAAAVEVAQ